MEGVHFDTVMQPQFVTALLAILLSAAPAIATMKSSDHHRNIILVVNSNINRLPLVHATRDFR